MSVIGDPIKPEESEGLGQKLLRLGREQTDMEICESVRASVGLP